MHKAPHGRKLVVCPAAVKNNWRDELERVRPKDTVTVAGENGWMIELAKDWIIINYDLIWRAKVPQVLEAFKPDVLILDEAHYLKSMDSKRSIMARKLGAKVPYVIALTGSPMPNGRPVELLPVFIALRRMGEKHFWAMVKKFCDPYRDKWGYHYDGASNMEEFNELLSRFMVRRLKKDVLKDLPEKHYSRMVVELTNWSEYEGLEEEHQNRVGVSQWDAYSGLMKLKEECAVGKVGGLFQRLQLIAAEKQKAVVFSGYLRPLWRLQERLTAEKIPCMLLTGEMSPEERHEAIKQFSEDPACLVALCSTMACGTGVNLQAASTVFFLDLPWTPSVKRQAEDRTHRIGQKACVQIIDVVAPEKIDRYLEEVLATKGANTDIMVDGISEDEAKRRVQEMYEEDAA
jgi:SWI/SNF-related matrix-associated actin-dependent regulator 1 of chromatin subfamily A